MKCQMMPRGGGGRRLRQRRHLRQGVLDVALPQVGEAGGVCGCDRGGAVPLARADDCDLVHSPAGLLCGSADPAADPPEIRGNPLRLYQILWNY